VLTAGCALIPPQSFLDPTAVGKFPTELYETGIRRVLTPREMPESYASATEPTADDLVPVSVEYRIGSGDTLILSIDDLIDQGRPWTSQQEINENGYIRIPRLGQVYVVGMSEAEIEHELTAQLREGGFLPDPVVIVLAQVKRNRYFSILGDVLGPGSYAIPQSDFRLLDALGVARGLGPTAKKLQVIRRLDTPRPPAPPGRPSDDGPAPGRSPDDRSPDDLVIPPPDEPEGSVGWGRAAFSDFAMATQDTPQTQDTQPAESDDAAALREAASPRSTQPRPADVPPMPQAQPMAPRLIIDPVTGETIEVRPEAPEAAPQATRPAGTLPDVTQPFDWDSLPEYELTQRVIEIDAEALQAGDPRMNIVVRDRDTIRVPIDAGLFYIMGEVNRPGVYSFNGRAITMKQAIGAIASGFTALAWPERVEIVRREKGTDKQIIIPVNMDRVFAGLEPDVELQDDDLVNVGTHILAPFLFVIRNSFRFTYGFGFVYDRNFADIDAYNPKINPQAIQEARRASGGLPF
jgi:polysaccharide export outer membrane protein